MRAARRICTVKEIVLTRSGGLAGIVIQAWVVEQAVVAKHGHQDMICGSCIVEGPLGPTGLTKKRFSNDHPKSTRTNFEERKGIGENKRI